MFNLDLNFASTKFVDSDEDSDVEIIADDEERSVWATLDRRILQRIASFLTRQRDRRSFCLLEIIGMPRKPLSNLSYLLYNLRTLRSLRIESDTPLPADSWGPLATRLPGLSRLRIRAPNIPGSQLSRSLAKPPSGLNTLHLIGTGNDLADDFIERIVQGSPNIRSLVVYSTSITGRSAELALCSCASLTHLELVRDEPEPASSAGTADIASPAVASRLNSLSLRNIDIPDALIQSASAVVTALRTLHIGGSTTVTGESVGALLAASTRLVALGLSNCANLSEKALLGLAGGSSAQLLQVLVISNCVMQSAGVEHALPALVNLKHLSIAGTEVLQQRFHYAFDTTNTSTAKTDTAETGADADADAKDDALVAENNTEQDQDRGTEAAERALPSTQALPFPITRQFELVYPNGHYIRKDEPADQGEGCQQAAGAESPKPIWRESLASGFIPGLLAFASRSAIPGDAARIGRRRATTISSDDHLVPPPGVPDVREADGTLNTEAVDGSRGIGRMRSISEQPANVEPIIVHDGSDYSPSPKSAEAQPSSPMERADISEAIERNIAADAQASGEQESSVSGISAAVAVAGVAAVAAIAGAVGAAAVSGEKAETGDAVKETEADTTAGNEQDAATQQPTQESNEEPVARSIDEAADGSTEDSAGAPVDAQTAVDAATQQTGDGPADAHVGPADALPTEQSTGGFVVIDKEEAAAAAAEALGESAGQQAAEVVDEPQEGHANEKQQEILNAEETSIAEAQPPKAEAESVLDAQAPVEPPAEGQTGS
ncbi:hypothetical protein GGI12_003298, partial [Dipsacomyces acuminosporus]